MEKRAKDRQIIPRVLVNLIKLPGQEPFGIVGGNFDDIDQVAPICFQSGPLGLRVQLVLRGRLAALFSLVMV